MQFTKTHPIYKTLVAVGSILGAFGFFAFQGVTSAEGISGSEVPDLWSLIIGFSFNFVEAAVLAFIAAPMAGKVSEVLESYGFTQSKKSIIMLERIIDSLCLGALVFVYVFDAYTTRKGALRRGWTPFMATAVAIFQLFLCEILLNVGLWLLEDAKKERMILASLQAQGEMEGS